ncbi:RNA polymerase sigma factor [Bacillus phage YungSlug]|nr:RNA polymerase sigma factor [Bacillus phage YungSlug]
MRDVNKLLEDYKPLILATYKRFHSTFKNKEDKEDLMSQIRFLFTKLVFEYDPRRGVDFPYYIKRMLELRTYHWVTKTLKQKNAEVITEGFTNDELTYGNLFDSLEDFERIIKLQSWDDNFTLGEKQKKLFIGLLVENKTIKELAEEEGVDASIIHTRMHFLVKKLTKQAKEQKIKEQEKE